MTTDQAVMQYRAPAGNEIRWIAFEANMNQLPATAEDVMLVPCHCYLYADHFQEKAALAHRRSSSGTYEISSNYFNEMGGSDNHIDVPAGEWRDRWLGLVDGFAAEGIAVDGAGDSVRLGDALDPPKETVEHVDFMSEIQYQGSMDLPSFGKNENRIIVSWVGTTDGVMRPADALVPDGEQQGTYARIDQLEDSWGRYWLYFWID